MNKFNEINKLKSAEIEKIFLNMPDEEKVEIIDFVINNQSSKRNKISLTFYRLIYNSPLFIENYDKYRDNLYSFLSEGSRIIFSRSNIVCSPLFFNKEFVKDIYEGFFMRNKSTFHHNGFLEKEKIFANILQSYFYNQFDYKFNEVENVLNYIIGKDNFNEQKMNFDLLRDLNEESFHEVYLYLKKNNYKCEVILKDDFFDDKIYQSGFFQTLNLIIEGKADYQKLKKISSNILNYKSSYEEIKNIWESFQINNEKKVNLLSIIKIPDLNKKFSEKLHKKIPLIIEKIINEDLSKTEVFMDDIIKQFLEKKIIKENIILTNKILSILNDNISKNNTYKSVIMSIIKNNENKDLLSNNSFDIQVLQTLINIDFIYNRKTIDLIKESLSEFSENKNILKLISFIEKKQIEDFSLNCNKTVNKNKKRL